MSHETQERLAIQMCHEAGGEWNKKVPRIGNRTAHIKPATREALMDQLALAADEIERLRGEVRDGVVCYRALMAQHVELLNRRFWHRFAWWRK